LGIDFLKANKSNVMISKGYITINGKKISCFSLSDEYKNPCCRISVCEDVEIPPESEMIIPCLLFGYLDQSKIGILEPTSQFIEKSGLLVAKSLISLQKEIIPLRVINLNKEACKLYRETIAGVVEPVEELKVERVNTMSPVEHDHTKETPDHLRELSGRSCENLNDNQSKTLESLLRKYADVFSKSKKDISFTNLVEHTIDTGSARPIKQRPYRIPLSKREQAKQEIKEKTENKIIQPSYGPRCSPIVMLLRKTVKSDFVAIIAN